jgi:hypothetical protein
MEIMKYTLENIFYLSYYGVNCYKFSSWDLFLCWFSNIMGLYAFGFHNFYSIIIIRYIWLITAIDIQTLYNLSHKLSHSLAIYFNTLTTHSQLIPSFANLPRIYTLWLFILWELFPRGSSMCDAHYSHLPRLVDHKSTHKLPIRTYIPSYLLKCLKFLFLFNNVRISCYSNVLTLYIFFGHNIGMHT